MLCIEIYILVELVRLDVDIQQSLGHVEHFQMPIRYFSTTLWYIYHNNYMNTVPMQHWYVL